jgi:RNA polymerase sigma-70 factor (ECF subfamily)
MKAESSPDERPRAAGDPGRSPPAGDVEQWIADARAGCSESLGKLAQRCRQYLLLVAGQELADDIRAKEGASDLVQETLLAAQQVFGRFEGTSEGELRLWLKRILLNKLAHASRSYLGTAMRDVRREMPLDDGHANSPGEPGHFIDQELTPRRSAIAREQADAIEQAIARLPEHHQRVIRLRSFERQSFVEIGRLLDISADAARKRWCQAIKRLRQQWEASDESR